MIKPFDKLLKHRFDHSRRGKESQIRTKINQKLTETGEKERFVLSHLPVTHSVVTCNSFATLYVL